MFERLSSGPQRSGRPEIERKRLIDDEILLNGRCSAAVICMFMKLDWALLKANRVPVLKTDRENRIQRISGFGIFELFTFI